MKHSKKVISMILAVCITISMMPAMAFADTPETKPINYVSLGDSMTNGYGFDAYYDGEQAKQVYGFRQNDVENSYAGKLAKELNAKWEQLAISCMRPEDVNFLLRFDTEDPKWIELAKKVSTDCNNGKKRNIDNWMNTIKGDWEETFVDDNGYVLGDYNTFEEMAANRFNDWGDAGHEDETGYPWKSNGTLAYAKYYQKAIKEADVISLGTGDSNFGTIMSHNLLGAMGLKLDGCSYEGATYSAVGLLETRLKSIPGGKDALEKINSALADYIDQSSFKAVLDREKVEQIENCVEYTVLSYMISYADMLEAIDNLNDKKLDVIVMGLINSIAGLKLKVGSTTVPIGDIAGVMFNLLSEYSFNLPVAMQRAGKLRNMTFYAVPVDSTIDMMSTEMKAVGGIKDNDTLRSRTIKQTNNTLFGLMGSAFSGLSEMGLGLGDIGSDTTVVKVYEEMKECTSSDAMAIFASKINESNVNAAVQRAFGAACYLAIENAIPVALQNHETLNLNSLMSIINPEGIGSAFSGITVAVAQTTSSDAFKQAVASGDAKKMIGCLEVGLTDAISADAAKENSAVGDILSMFARFLVGDGVGAHPSVQGHEQLFNNIKAVYIDHKITAKARMNDKGKEILDVVLEEGPDFLKGVLEFAKTNNIITDEQQLAIISGLIDKIAAEIDKNKIEKAYDYCVKLADLLEEYAGKRADRLANIEKIKAAIEKKNAEHVANVKKITAAVKTAINKAITNTVERINKFNNNVTNFLKTLFSGRLIRFQSGR